MPAFSVDNLQRELPITVNIGRFKLKRMTFFANRDNLPRFENKGIAGIIINCTSPTTTSKATSTFNNNKKVKTNYQNAKTYHRWFLCADAMNPPHTFAIVCHNNRQTWELLQHVHDNSFIGMPFYLIEPDLSTSKVGDYLHVLPANEPKLFPLKIDAKILRKPAPIELPSDDQTFFFLQESQRITLTRMKYTTNTCSGYQCDRHWGKNGCVCAYASQGSSLVYEFDIALPVDKKQFGSDIHVASISSFRTMEVFFHNLVEYTHATTSEKEDASLIRRRSQVRRMIKYINNKGGWKLIGWCKRGLLTIDGETEKVESNEVNLRLSYVYPQNIKILDDPDFKELRIKEDFDTPDALLENLDDDESDNLSSDDSSTDDDEEDNTVDINDIQQYNQQQIEENNVSNSQEGSSGVLDQAEDDDATVDEDANEQNEDNAEDEESVTFSGFPDELAQSIRVDEYDT